MRGLDDTDREILRLLLADARRPYSEIAETVDLSAPAVSDRVDRLRETGLVRRFTLDIDRELLEGGSRVLLTVEATPGRGPALQRALMAVDAVEHVFRTADERLVCVATVTDSEDGVTEWVDPGDMRDYDIRPLADESWAPRLGGSELAPACEECGNTVTREGESATIDGETHHFCCENCQESFVDRYERLRDGA
ncbi:MAG: Lrp/AsnC family leucine-responsive transcriptional regulator [Salinirussus sp.]|jgi:Lrp/AsnC family leucine-responsive transcriptional regulator